MRCWLKRCCCDCCITEAESYMSRSFDVPVAAAAATLMSFLLLLKVVTTYDTLASDFAASGGQVRPNLSIIHYREVTRVCAVM